MTLVRTATVPADRAGEWWHDRCTRVDEEMLRRPRARAAWGDALGVTLDAALDGRSASACEPGAR